jgi:hypothetical protein
MRAGGGACLRLELELEVKLFPLTGWRRRFPVFFFAIRTVGCFFLIAGVALRAKFRDEGVGICGWEGVLCARAGTVRVGSGRHGQWRHP